MKFHELPTKIVLRNGRLRMQDGSSLTAYLQAVQKEQKITDGTVVNVVDHASLKNVLSEIEMLCSLGS